MKRREYERSFAFAEKRPLKGSSVIRILREIFDEHSARVTRKVSAHDGSDTKNETAKNFLRREIYALGTRLRNSSREPGNAEKFLTAMGRPASTRPEALENVFHALLYLLYEREEGFTRQERSLIGRELEYAYQHEVPPKLLVGFLYQSTDRKRLGERLKAGFREPAFR
jgi:hypothetical protein